MSTKSLYQTLKPFVGIILQQFGYAGMSILSMFALNKGMSQHVLVVYRHVIAAAVFAPFAIVLDRKTRPKMTTSVFTKIMLLALLEPVIDQNLYYTGMKVTSATFATAMWNIVPAFAFVMAWILRLEKVDVRRVHSQAKVLGTILTVGGAMVMTLVTGPTLKFPWTKDSNIHHESAIAPNNKKFVQGALMIIAGCVSWSCFIIVQAVTLKSYPAELSLTALICLVGAVEGVVPALALEWGNPTAWAIHFDSKLLAIFYGGIVCSGFSFYIQGVVMKDRGPVFVSSFIPFQLVIVAILSSFILFETMSLGMVIGAIIIVLGLYMNLWGKSKDHRSSESDGKVLSQLDEDATPTNENTKNLCQELVAIGHTRGTHGDESVWKN